MLERDAVDIILLDLILPDNDGLTLIQRFIRRVAFIIVSGRGNCADRVIGLERGADDYVAKPFELRVSAALRRAHDWKESVGSTSAADAKPMESGQH